MVKFGALLGIRRKAAGHSSARSFFKSQGGSGFFACSYKQYLNVEAGRSVPGPRLFGRIVSALHLEPQTEESHQLALSYLQGVLKDGDAAAFTAAALGRSARPGGSRDELFERAVRHGFAQRKHSLDEKQAAFVRRNRENFWCFTALVHDSGGFFPDELAAAVRLPAAAARRALAGLARMKLAVRAKSGAFSSPLSKKIILFPAKEPKGGYGIRDLDAEFEAMSAKFGDTDFEWNFFVRASAADMKSMHPLLTESVRGAEIFTTQEKKADTAFYRVRAQILKILPF